MICNDRWNPRLAEIPVLDGAQFLVIPAMGSRSQAQDQAVLSRGRENGVPVVEANVGVTLVVDGGRISAVDRHEEGITFGQITIPPATADGTFRGARASSGTCRVSDTGGQRRPHRVNGSGH